MYLNIQESRKKNCLTKQIINFKHTLHFYVPCGHQHKLLPLLVACSLSGPSNQRNTVIPPDRKTRLVMMSDVSDYRTPCLTIKYDSPDFYLYL